MAYFPFSSLNLLFNPHASFANKASDRFIGNKLQSRETERHCSFDNPPPLAESF